MRTPDRVLLIRPAWRRDSCGRSCYPSKLRSIDAVSAWTSMRWILGSNAMLRRTATRQAVMVVHSGTPVQLKRMLTFAHKAKAIKQSP